MNDNDPNKPTADQEKFKPENVAADVKRDENHPADTERRDLPRGSETDTRGSSKLRR
jgi:hypothetical protein